MKNLLPFLGALALLLTSCSSDDNDVTSSLTKVSRISNVSSNNFTDYKYDGDKIVSQTNSKGSSIKYTYTGDLITKVEDFGSDKQLESTKEYTYTNGKLISILKKYPDSPVKSKSSVYYNKTKFTYNADGTISIKDSSVDSSTGAEQESAYSSKYTYKDGNLVKFESFYNDSPQEIYAFEYDTKNTPFKNVTGVSALMDFEGATSQHNNTKFTNSNSNVDKSAKVLTFSSFKKAAAKAMADFVVSFTYVYDENNFPTEMKTMDSNGNSSLTKYTY